VPGARTSARLSGLFTSEKRQAINQKNDKCQKKADCEGRPLLRYDELLGSGAVAGTKETFQEKTAASAKKRTQQENRQGYLKNALGDDERLERHGERRYCGKKYAGQRVLLHEDTKSPRSSFVARAIVGLARFSSEQINPDTTSQGPDGGHRRVIRRAQRVPAGQFHQQKISD